MRHETRGGPVWYIGAPPQAALRQIQMERPKGEMVLGGHAIASHLRLNAI
jgi:hypothetical protein